MITLDATTIGLSEFLKSYTEAQSRHGARWFRMREEEELHEMREREQNENISVAAE